MVHLFTIKPTFIFIGIYLGFLEVFIENISKLRNALPMMLK